MLTGAADGQVASVRHAIKLRGLMREALARSFHFQAVLPVPAHNVREGVFIRARPVPEFCCFVIFNMYVIICYYPGQKMK